MTTFPSEVVRQTKYLNIWLVGQSPSGKTNIYSVLTNDGLNTWLGDIKWYGPWRKYVFYPTKDTLFEEVCLRDISQFLLDITKKHREINAKP